MNEEQEGFYIDGEKAAYRHVMLEVERALRGCGVETDQASCIREVHETRERVKWLFEDLGIDGYAADLYLPDLIEKVLQPALELRGMNQEDK